MAHRQPAKKNWRRLLELSVNGIDIYRHDSDQLTILYGMLPYARALKLAEHNRLNATPTLASVRENALALTDNQLEADRIASNFLMARFEAQHLRS